MFQEIQKYVWILYGQLCDDDVNIAQYNLFNIGQYSESTTPCTKDILLLHISRASYQAYIWKCALQAIISSPSMADLGWEIRNDQVLVKWMTMPVALDILENVNCGCRSGFSSERCACVKAELN